jgi:BirA family biotin operon repressor/biotin-[acetyl-CoA-carboxylase] ligase
MRRAIADSSGLAVGLKWPNDLYLNGGKLGGILVEIEPLPGGTSLVVAGIGVNVDLSAEQRASVSELPGGARDLAGALSGAPPERSQLAGAMIGRLVELFAGFATTGFAAYQDEWSAAHVLDGEPVARHTGARVDFGVVRGIEPDGALIVEDDQGQCRRHTAGDVTVRMSA